MSLNMTQKSYFLENFPSVRVKYTYKVRNFRISVFSVTLCFQGWRIDLARSQVSIRSGTIRTCKIGGSNFEYLSLIQSFYNGLT